MSFVFHDIDILRQVILQNASWLGFFFFFFLMIKLRLYVFGTKIDVQLSSQWIIQEAHAAG